MYHLTHHSLKWWGDPSQAMWSRVEPHQGILSRDKKQKIDLYILMWRALRY